MVETLNTKIVKDTFDKAYTEDQFRLFIKDLLVDADFSKEQQYKMITNDYTDFIKSYKRICMYEYIDPEFSSPKVIDVLVVKLKKTSSIERARTAQRNFVARYLNGLHGYQKDAALVAFISEDENEKISPDWRFSFIQMNYVTKFVETTNGKKKLKTEVELTPAKRFSFLVGSNEYTHTAQQQFSTCLEKSAMGEKITVEDLVQAFDIEKVSKEFFEEYKKLYLKLVEELNRLYKSDAKVQSDFNNHNINIDDFAKKTLGQLVFLYFIQKKGWLGVEPDKDWGTGDKKFLRNVFDKKYCDYKSFFNDILEHLFYEALAKDRTDKKDLFKDLNCRIPFLNGGLFEPVNGYEWTKTDLTIDNSIFKDIFDTFDLYNFTVKEDEPLEKEVAIDPEMLGKVFENLLPENIRKGNGAFYTPREIVHYMCQENLINYLYNKINIKQVELSPEEKAEQQTLFKKKKIDQLKLTQDVLDEIIPKEDLEFFIKTGTSTYTIKKRNINVKLSDKIINNAQLLDNALLEIKVCDPAIGSGAFPVGMMNEIVRARASLSKYINKPNRSIYELKRNAIENSIYGIDIDAGAVDIAKLRFWLSLVVDEEDIKNIKPLPNLDYKIMQGNSLITSFEGIDFDEIVANQPQNKQLFLFSTASEKITDKISHLINQITNNYNETQKKEIKQKIENLIVELVKTKFEEKAELEGKSKNFYEEKIRNFAQNKENRNFFPWKLFFADAFDKGGFDVVIGNPPYVKEYTERSAFDGLRESPYYQGKMDLWYFFGCKGLDILKTNGTESFIAPNNWTTNAGASIFRNKIMKESKIINFTDFGNYKVFDTASIQTMVYLLCKNGNNKGYNLNYSKLLKDDISKNELETFLSDQAENNYYIKYNLNFDNSNYYDKFITFLNPEINNLINKISANGKYHLNDKNVAQGIVAPQDSLNKKCQQILGAEHKVGEGIFILSDAEKNDLNLTEDEINDLIRPLYTSNEINRYKSENKNKYWIIYTSSKFKNSNEIKPYPNIKKHLDQYANIITSDNKPYGLHRSRDNDFFIGDKIISLRKCQKPTFSYVDFDCYVMQTFYSIKPNDINLKYLTALLNSKLIEYWLKMQGKMQGDNYQIDKEPLLNIPINKPKTEIQNMISNIVDSIYDMTGSNDYSESIKKQEAVKEYEKQIDIIVYKLYDLTYSEVKTIDPEFTMSEEEYNNFEL